MQEYVKIRVEREKTGNLTWSQNMDNTLQAAGWMTAGKMKSEFTIKATG
jgi:hypothetical protein